MLNKKLDKICLEIMKAAKECCDSLRENKEDFFSVKGDEPNYKISISVWDEIEGNSTVAYYATIGDKENLKNIKTIEKNKKSSV